MHFEYTKIREAFEFVSAGSFSSRQALLDTETGEILLQAEPGESNGFPDDSADQRYVPVPHRIHLRLGKPLVIAFTKQQMPEALAKVCGMFCSRSAYSRFDEFLVANGMLGAWREFERQETERALREWCQTMGISLVG